MKYKRKHGLVAISIIALPFGLVASERAAEVRTVAGFEVETLAPGVYVLRSPPGGNILVRTRGDATVAVDAQDGALSDSLVAALTELGVAMPEIVVNTHYHWDHIGGNGALRALGAETVAHETVPAQASRDTFIAALGWQREAADSASLPTSLLSSEAKFAIAGEDYRVVHRPDAHTDGDLTVHFDALDIVHTGDLVEVGAYPFVDWWAGGTLDGLIDAVDAVLAESGAGTRYVPGHGPTVDRAFVAEYRDMLVTLRARVRAAIEEGATLEAVQTMGLSAEFDAANGGERRGGQFVGLLYLGLDGAASPD